MFPSSLWNIYIYIYIYIYIEREKERERMRITYGLEWLTVYALARGLVWRLLLEL